MNKAAIKQNFEASLHRMEAEVHANIIHIDVLDDGQAQQFTNAAAARVRVLMCQFLIDVGHPGASTEIHVPNLPSHLQVGNALAAALGAAGGFWAASAISSIILGTVTTGMLWWKSTTVVTVASTLASYGVPLAVPGIGLAIVGALVLWKIADAVTSDGRRAERQREVAEAFTKHIIPNVLLWADEVLATVPPPREQPVPVTLNGNVEVMHA